MDLTRPDLWAWVEDRCKGLGFGELTLQIDVVDGMAAQVNLTLPMRQSYRGLGRKVKPKAQELIE